MNRTAMIAALLVALASSLTACDKPTVNVGTTPTVVAGPAGPAGMDGKDGSKGEPGKAGDTTTVIVTPAQDAPKN